MNYLAFMWWTFWIDGMKGRYLPFASCVCRIMMPCMPEWEENFQHDFDNDNSIV